MGTKDPDDMLADIRPQEIETSILILAALGTLSAASRTRLLARASWINKEAIEAASAGCRCDGCRTARAALAEVEAESRVVH